MGLFFYFWYWLWLVLLLLPCLPFFFFNKLVFIILTRTQWKYFVKNAITLVKIDNFEIRYSNSDTLIFRWAILKVKEMTLMRKKKNLQLWSVVISENSVSIPSVLYIIYLHSIFKYTSILQTNIITKPAKGRLRETWRRTRRLLQQMMSLRSTTEELKPCHLL